jgi:Uma2 family endonuclease
MAAGFSEFDAWTSAAVVPRLLTAEDFALMPDQLPSGPVQYVLHDGRLVTDRLLTIEDMEGLPEELPTGPVKFELDNGELVPMSPPADEHGAVQSNIAAELKFNAERAGMGRSRTETSVVLWRDPDRMVIPDVLFVTNDSLPIRHTRERYFATIPEITVEVTSKNDSTSMVANKVADYLKAGVKVVWIADPATKTVTVHRAGRDPEVFGGDDVLVCEDVLPGFRLPLVNVFAM